MPWYAIYTKPRHEKKVYQQLVEKDIVVFLPMTKSLRQWKDRRKWVEMPLFTGYVFIDILLKNKIEALQTRGVVKMVSFGGVPASIPDWQIEQLKKVISQPESLRLEQYLKKGDTVEVIAGPLKGVKGYLREIRGETRVAILIDGIYQSASFEVQKNFVKKIEKIEE
jgi:transcription elongation factor/antiterminator RfaH